MKKEKNFYKKSSPCTITPQDIYDNTNFFKEKQPQSRTYKLAFISSIIVVFLSFTMIAILSIQNYNLKNKGPEVQYLYEKVGVIDDTQGMSVEIKDKVNSELDFFYRYPICSFVHHKDIIIYLYYGYNINSDNKKVYNYYYAVGCDDDKILNLNISINDEIIKVNNSNRTGLLTSIDGSITNDFTLRFTVSTSDRTALYVLNNCDF